MKEITKIYQKEGLENEIYEQFRLRLVDSVALTFSVFMILSIVPKLIVPKWFFFPDVFTIVVAGILLSTRLMKDRYAKLAIFRLTLFFSGYIVLPVTCIFLKTNSWMMVPWIINIFIGYKIEFGYKWGIAPALLGIAACNFGMYYFDPIDPIIASLPARIFSNFVPSFLCFFVVQYFEYTLRNELMHEIHKMERQETTSRIIKSLNKELNNPLGVALDSLKSARENTGSSEKLMGICEKNLFRIKDLIEELNEYDKEKV